MSREMGTRASLFERLVNPVEREHAWGEFRARYAPLIATFAMRCGAKQQDVDDIIQDVMTGFFGASGEFVYNRERGAFRGYLKTCTVRATIRRIGKNARYRGMPLEEIADAEVAVEPIWEEAWEQQLMGEALTRVREETDNGGTFRAFEQYVLLDRPAEIVAAELGVSVNSVHQAKSRITKRLREVVAELQQEEI